MDWREAHQKLLQDKKRKKAYEKLDLGFEIGRMVTDGRIARKMTQEKLAKLLGTKQPSIARVEGGNYLPSFNFLQRVAKALDTQLLPPRLQILENTEAVKTKAVADMAYFSTISAFSWELILVRRIDYITNQTNAVTTGMNYALS